MKFFNSTRRVLAQVVSDISPHAALEVSYTPPIHEASKWLFLLSSYSIPLTLLQHVDIKNQEGIVVLY